MMNKTLFPAIRVLGIALPLALAACTSAQMQMPTGYTYHGQVYKSWSGPEASPPAKILKCGDKTANGMTVVGSDTVTLTGNPDANGNYSPEAICTAGEDLVGRMLKNFGRPMEPVLVPPMSPLGPCLMAALQKAQVPVAANPGDGPFVLEHSLSGNAASITFLSNHDPVTSESGNYDAPAAPLVPMQE